MAASESPFVAWAQRVRSECRRPDSKSISVPTTPTTDPSEDTGDEAADPDAAPSFGVIGPWADSGAIPVTYTCDGANTSPALTWGDIPAGTAEIAVSLTDDDAPDFMHWVVVGLPGEQRGSLRRQLGELLHYHGRGATLRTRQLLQDAQRLMAT